MGILLSLIAAYLALLSGVYVLQPRMLYIPDGALIGTPADLGLAYEDVEIPTQDEIRLHGWYVPAQDERAIVLFFHGNAGNISHRLEFIHLLHRLDLTTLIIDYRGYGLSTGRPSETGTYRDAEAAWHHLRQVRGIPAERIVVMGRSLGGAVAAYLATRHRPAALIVESSFTSVPDLAAQHYWYLPVRLLSRFGYPTREYIAQARCPVLVVHSPEDEIVPFRHGETLFAAAPEPKDLLSIRGDHNAGFIVSGRTYTDGLGRFIDAALAGR